MNLVIFAGMPASGKSTVANAGDVILQRNGGEAGTIAKQSVLYGGNPERQYDGLQSHAALEGRAANVDDALRNGDGSGVAAAIESVGTNGINAIGNVYLCHAEA